MPAKKSGPVEFVFDEGNSSTNCSAVVTKRQAKARRKRRRESAKAALIKANIERQLLQDDRKAKAKAEQEKDVLDRNKVWRSIRALSASQLKGWKLREWKEQQRRELGAKATKNQRMPLKMRMGIMKKRKYIAKKEAERVRESGVVTSQHKGNKNKRKRAASERRRTGGSAKDGDVGNGGIRDGVMNISFLLKK